MSGPRGYNLIFLKADGGGVLRLTVPRWLALAAAALVPVLGVSLGLLYTDYRALREQRAGLAQVHARLAEQQAQVEVSERRAREIRAEIESWRELHARIWEPFGPEAGPAKRGTGVGGPAQPPVEWDRAGVKAEMERLLGLVREEGELLRQLERFLGRATKVLATLPSRWPVRGPVNSDFGKRASPWGPAQEFHGGLDIGAPIGTPVRAPAPGTVVFAGRHPEFGVTVVVEHGNETKSLYGHLSKVNVQVDQKIRRGDLLALTGNTGRSSGPHLHYEIQVKGQPVNPHTYLWE